MRGHAVRAGCIDQCAQRRPRFRSRKRVQPAQGFTIVEVGDMRAWRIGFIIDRRIARTQTERRIQRPLVHFGGDVELVEWGLERQRSTGGVFAHDDGVVRPIQQHPRPRDVRAPALQRVRIEGEARPRFQRCACTVEIQVGAGESARVLEGFHHDAKLNRFPRARNAGRVRRAPRLPSPRPVVRRGWFPAWALRRARSSSASRPRA